MADLWCGACGSPLGGARVCAACGTPVLLPDPEATQEAPPVDDTQLRHDPWVPPAPPPPPLWADQVPPTTQSSAPPPSLTPAAPPPITSPVRRKRRFGMVAIVLALLLLGGAGVGAWLLARDDDGGRDARSADDDDRVTSASSPPSDEPAAVEATEEPTPPEPEQVTFSDSTGDSRLGNRGSRLATSADVRDVHVIAPGADTPGWVVVQLAETSPGVGVILRVDTDDDGWPDLTAWQHTATGASGSFEIADWSHGDDILARDTERDPHFGATGQPAPMSGTAFALAFAAGELPDGRIRINLQTVNDEQFYDYYPGRQQWSRPLAFEAAP